MNLALGRVAFFPGERLVLWVEGGIFNERPFCSAAAMPLLVAKPFALEAVPHWVTRFSNVPSFPASHARHLRPARLFVDATAATYRLTHPLLTQQLTQMCVAVPSLVPNLLARGAFSDTITNFATAFSLPAVYTRNIVPGRHIVKVHLVIIIT